MRDPLVATLREVRPPCSALWDAMARPESFSVLQVVRAHALPTETMWEAVLRCLVFDALEEGGDGNGAARLLGVSKRQFSYWRIKFGLGVNRGRKEVQRGVQEAV